MSNVDDNVDVCRRPIILSGPSDQVSKLIKIHLYYEAGFKSSDKRLDEIDVCLGRLSFDRRHKPDACPTKGLKKSGVDCA
jgi:hypothetical protein